MDIKEKIREIPNWPINGVNFKDITTLLEDKDAFRYVIDEMVKPFIDSKIDKVVAIDARGFLLATPIAYKLNAGVSLVRKKGKLPSETISFSYIKEYGQDILAMHKDTIKSGENVLIVDDLLATGGTLEATVQMVEELKGNIIGITYVIDLPFLGGRDKFKKYNIHYLVEYDKE